MQCYSEKYRSWMYFVAFAAAAFAIGVPMLFLYLVTRFKTRGQEGEKVVISALGWMCTSNLVYILCIFICFGSLGY